MVSKQWIIGILFLSMDDHSRVVSLNDINHEMNIKLMDDQYKVQRDKEKQNQMVTNLATGYEIVANLEAQKRAKETTTPQYVAKVPRPTTPTNNEVEEDFSVQLQKIRERAMLTENKASTKEEASTEQQFIQIPTIHGLVPRPMMPTLSTSPRPMMPTLSPSPRPMMPTLSTSPRPMMPNLPEPVPMAPMAPMVPEAPAPEVPAAPVVVPKPASLMASNPTSMCFLLCIVSSRFDP